MYIYPFAKELINEASKWADCKEDPGRANRSVCVDKIHLYVTGRVSSEPWCSEFVSMITDITAKKFNVKNLLPVTASTAYMKSQAEKNGLRVDKSPAVGSVFHYYRDGSLGHVGFIAEVKSDGRLGTVEGNSDDRVTDIRFGFKIRTPHSGYSYIHTEEMAGTKSLPVTKSDYFHYVLAGSGLLIGGLIYAVKKDYINIPGVDIFN